MTLLLDDSILLDEIRDNLASIPYDLLDDVQIYKAIKDSYEYIEMIVDIEQVEEKFVRRCLIRLSTYKAYLIYTSLAEPKLGTLPESAPLQLSSLLMSAYSCLTMISKVPLNEDLSLKESSYPLPIGAGLTSSSVT
ncbi:MAG: hypothetical protein WC877_01740 [Dehalococcoidales bacterium]|jgi:hypothetical protein